MALTDLAGRSRYASIINASSVGTIAGLMTAFEAGMAAHGWTVTTSGDNVTTRAALCVAAGSATASLQIGLCYDTGTPAFSEAAPGSGTAITSVPYLCCAPVGGIANAAALLGASAPAAPLFGRWRLGVATANYYKIDIWSHATYQEDVEIWLNNATNTAFYCAIMGAPLVALHAANGVGSNDADGRLWMGYSGRAGVLASSWPIQAPDGTSTTNLLGDGNSSTSTSPACRYYRPTDSTIRRCGRAYQQSSGTSGIHTDLNGRLVRPPIIIADVADWTTLGQLRALYYTDSIFADTVKDLATGVTTYGLGWSPGTTVKPGILAAA